MASGSAELAGILQLNSCCIFAPLCAENTCGLKIGSPLARLSDGEAKNLADQLDLPQLLEAGAQMAKVSGRKSLPLKESRDKGRNTLLASLDMMTMMS